MRKHKLSGLTKKHFEGLVQVLRETRPHECSDGVDCPDHDTAEALRTWEFVCHKLTCELAEANPAFDVQRFKAALNK